MATGVRIDFGPYRGSSSDKSSGLEALQQLAQARTKKPMNDRGIRVEAREQGWYRAWRWLVSAVMLFILFKIAFLSVPSVPQNWGDVVAHYIRWGLPFALLVIGMVRFWLVRSLYLAVLRREAETPENVLLGYYGQRIQKVRDDLLHSSERFRLQEAMEDVEDSHLVAIANNKLASRLTYCDVLISELEVVLKTWFKTSSEHRPIVFPDVVRACNELDAKLTELERVEYNVRRIFSASFLASSFSSQLKHLAVECDGLSPLPRFFESIPPPQLVQVSGDGYMEDALDPTLALGARR